MNLKLFIVYGMTGEYSDRNEWSVAACFTREAADKLEHECTEFARAHHVHRTQDVANYEARDALLAAIKAGLPAPDPSICIDYTGTDYCVGELDVHCNEAELEYFADQLIAARHAKRTT